MRKNIHMFSLMFVFFFSFTLIAQQYQDWKWQHQSPQGNALRWVKMWDANSWYAVGFAGTFLKTNDGGTTWTFHHKVGNPFGTSLQNSNIYDAHFFNQQTGIAVGTGSSIHRTTDAGATWTQTTLPAGFLTTITFYQVHFYDANNGFAAGSSGKLLKTTDAGLNWTEITTGITTALYDVFSADGNTILLATTSANIRRTTDGGASWATVASGGTSFTVYKVHLYNATNGYATGSAGQCRYTTDAGATWTSVSTGLPSGTSFYDIDIVGSSVFLTGDSFNLYKSTNNGANWDTSGFLAPVAQQPWTSTRYATDFGATENDFVNVGGFGLMNKKYKTFTDFRKAGIIYDMWSSPDGQKIITVGAPSATGGSFDQIFYSTNGGANWQVGTTTKFAEHNKAVEVLDTEESIEVKGSPLTPSSLTTFRSIDMIDQNTGYAVGTLSALYKTTNGGITWDSVVTNLPAAHTFYKVDFLTSTLGWVFSYTANTSGTIFKTTDGGATFTQQTLGAGLTGLEIQIYNAHMLNENVGYVVNYTPRPYKTTDGGATWTQQNLIDGYTGTLYDIHMVNENVGYLAGGSGRIYKTTNGGTSWDTLTIPTRSYTHYNVHFVDANKGMVTGSSGVVFYTTDGGTTWEQTNTSAATQYALSRSATSKGDEIFYIAGSSSYIHKRVFSAPQPVINWANLQWPPADQIVRGDSSTVYAQAWIDGATPAPGPTPGLECWIGVNSTNTNPATWTKWYSAPFNVQVGNNDEFWAKIGYDLPAGTYYYASRWQYQGGSFKYGGYSQGGGGFWDSTTYVSGVLTVTPMINTLWQKSAATSTLPAWFSTTHFERGIAYGKTNSTESNERLFVVSRNGGNFVKIIDAATGNDVGNLNTTGVAGGTFVINDVEVSEDGKIFAANMTLNATTDTFRVYMWTNENSAPVAVIKTLLPDAVRIGDKITLVGNYAAGTATLYAGSATANQLKVYKWTMNGGVFNQLPATIQLTGYTSPTAPNSVSIAPLPNGDFYWKATGHRLIKFTSAGAFIDTIPGTVVASGSNAVRYLGQITNKEYVAVFQYGAGNENARIVEIPINNLAGAVTYEISPTLGTNTNTNGSGDVAFKLNPNGTAVVYVLSTNNGFGAYATLSPVPVELTSFVASAIDKDVILNWSTATEVNSKEFQIERNNGSGWNQIASVNAAGTSVETKSYSFVDKNVEIGKLSYRLKMVDFDGSYEYSNIVNVEFGVPDNFSISQNYPNPFNPSTKINYQIPADANVTIELYDVTGQKVGSLINQEMKAGYYSFDLDASKFGLATGIYIYRMVAINKENGASFVESKKLMLVK